jgi:hypothetical protein
MANLTAGIVHLGGYDGVEYLGKYSPHKVVFVEMQVRARSRACVRACVRVCVRRWLMDSVHNLSLRRLALL